MRVANWSVCLGVVVFFAMSLLGLAACLWWFTSSSVQPQPAPSSSPPHIIIILADDLGWNDVSFHGSDQFQTPNIDALAYSGVILQDYYTQPICTPSRAALLTGRHPISNGMEHDVIYAPQPWGLPLTERILPEYLKPLGYTSRMIGKWHLGFFQSNYTPARRGFDTHYGIWLGHQDHISHMGYEAHPGYDFHRELSVTWDAVGQYSANLFIEEAENIIREHDSSRPLFLYLAHTAPHAPLQAPSNIVQRFSYIPNKKRQTYAAMVTMLDESVGQVMAALKAKNMLNNTIILFLSDNGGATNGFNGNVASNWPFRGGKDTLWEGGVRAAGLIWSPLLGNTPRVHRGLVNVQDWLPTLLEAAGAPVDKNVTRVDGVSQWKALQQKSDPPYTTMLHNIDPQRNIAALRHDHWKVVIGRTYNGAYDGFFGKLSGKVPYNLDRVRISEAGKAVMSSPSPLPLDTEMLQMRVDATVSCTNPMPTTLAPTPHVIQVREATFTMDDPRIEATQTKDKDTILKQKKRVGDATTSKITTDKTTNAPTTVAPGICQPHLSPCLFNLRDDPCETHNLASEFPEILQQLMAILQGYHPVPPNNKPSDPRSFPEHWNNTWTTWQDFL